MAFPLYDKVDHLNGEKDQDLTVKFYYESSDDSKCEVGSECEPLNFFRVENGVSCVSQTDDQVMIECFSPEGRRLAVTYGLEHSRKWLHFTFSSSASDNGQAFIQIRDSERIIAENSI